MNSDKSYWNKLANIYNRMFEKDRAYQKLYALIKKELKPDMTLLEAGTGSGMIARAVSGHVQSVFAIDYAPAMIARAKELSLQSNIIFSVQDSTDLQFEDKNFDAVIISNVLHIMENPQNCLEEITRVLKDDGILIAPTFMWKEIGLRGKIHRFFMKKAGFPIHFEWNSAEYLDFLIKNGFETMGQESIEGIFPICYAQCRKSS